MILVTFSVVVTIGVLNVNFRTPATHKVINAAVRSTLPASNLASLSLKLGHVFHSVKLHCNARHISELILCAHVRVAIKSQRHFRKLVSVYEMSSLLLNLH